MSERVTNIENNALTVEKCIVNILIILVNSLD